MRRGELTRKGLRVWLAAGVLALAACNDAPLDYTRAGVAPGGAAPWGTPTEVACDERPDADSDVFVDGFTLCGRDNAIVPIDDPVLEPCTADALAPREDVFYVFDGVDARAYRIASLIGRELVHDEWGEIPLLVDW